MIKSKLSVAVFCLAFSGVSAQVKDTLAEKMIVYQLPNGGWGKHNSDKKNVDYTAKIDSKLLKIIKANDNDLATIDNNATSKEINTLIKVYSTTKNPAYLKSAEKGIEYLLSMQYQNGGFPQYFPNSAIYRKQVTYNDNAMINVLTVLYNISEGKEGFDAVNFQLKDKSKVALQKGIACILKTQILQNGKLSIWADQYNEVTLKPEKARAFEPMSLASGESVNIVKFLMMQPVTPEIEKSIKSAIQWFKESKIDGYTYNVSRESGNAVRVLSKKEGSAVWARFYDIPTNKPIFGDRDGSVKFNYEDVSEERRMGYSWYNEAGTKLIENDFQKWLKKNKISG
ncbi:pectate lyase [Chryseobacterium sp. Ch-15]|uniref:Pectate lyase n=1 Tax=Chryseobacterium muglaense TaxID=2893752 RepID=A0A9Q3UU23_9FLAO|nr:pectate lyase [Chryseobacterium muglaense]MBD3903505.1 pectate lyase [Chryseobacterium muglaense]MCC9034577.1 pectate lyase [Chryseobacterium muglaense]MCM2552840.1 pectate lyase [Chryseobacterium muglaense]